MLRKKMTFRSDNKLYKTGRVAGGLNSSEFDFEVIHPTSSRSTPPALLIDVLKADDLDLERLSDLIIQEGLDFDAIDRDSNISALTMLLSTIKFWKKEGVKHELIYLIEFSAKRTPEILTKVCSFEYALPVKRIDGEMERWTLTQLGNHLLPALQLATNQILWTGGKSRLNSIFSSFNMAMKPILEQNPGTISLEDELSAEELAQNARKLMLGEVLKSFQELQGNSDRLWLLEVILRNRRMIWRDVHEMQHNQRAHGINMVQTRNYPMWHLCLQKQDFIVFKKLTSLIRKPSSLSSFASAGVLQKKSLQIGGFDVNVANIHTIKQQNEAVNPKMRRSSKGGLVMSIVTGLHLAVSCANELVGLLFLTELTKLGVNVNAFGARPESAQFNLWNIDCNGQIVIETALHMAIRRRSFLLVYALVVLGCDPSTPIVYTGKASIPLKVTRSIRPGSVELWQQGLVRRNSRALFAGSMTLRSRKQSLRVVTTSQYVHQLMPNDSETKRKIQSALQMKLSPTDADLLHQLVPEFDDWSTERIL